MFLKSLFALLALSFSAQAIIVNEAVMTSGSVNQAITGHTVTVSTGAVLTSASGGQIIATSGSANDPRLTGTGTLAIPGAGGTAAITSGTIRTSGSSSQSGTAASVVTTSGTTVSSAGIVNYSDGEPLFDSSGNLFRIGGNVLSDLNDIYYSTGMPLSNGDGVLFYAGGGTLTDGANVYYAGTSNKVFDDDSIYFQNGNPITDGTQIYAPNGTPIVNGTGGWIGPTISLSSSSTTSGTAGYAFRSGTAVTISGTIPATQVSGTIASSGTSAYAAQSGTSQYALQSGTAQYALNSGTSASLTGTINGATQISGAVPSATVASTSSNSLQLGGTFAASFAQTTGSYPGMTSGTSNNSNALGGNAPSFYAPSGQTIASASNALTSATATQLGQQVVTAKGLGMVSSATSASGTTNSTLLNAALANGDKVIVESGTYWFAKPILVQTGNTIEAAGDVTFGVATNGNCVLITNKHWKQVNLSGSSGITFSNGVTLDTESPLVSSTSPVYGDTNILIRGIKMNPGSQSGGIGVGGYYDVNFPVTSGSLGRERSIVGFFGVSHSRIEACTFVGGSIFGFCADNCLDLIYSNCWDVNTAGQSFALDDPFHFRGSCINCGLMNCGAIFNSDNGYAFNPGEQISPTDNSADPYGSYGNDYNCFAFNFYENADGPGFYAVANAGGSGINHTGQNYSFKSQGMFWADSNSAAYGYNTNSLMTFGGGNFNFTFSDSYVGTGRNQTFPLSNFNGGLSIVGYRCPQFQSALSGSAAFTVGASSTCGAVSIVNAEVSATGSAPSGSFVSFGGNSFTSSVRLSNNLISGFNYVLSNSNTVANTITSFSGIGNTFANNGEVLFSGYAPSDCGGQFAKSLGDMRTDEYLNSTFNTVASGTYAYTQSATVTDPVRAFVNGLHQMGLWKHVLFQITKGNFPIPTGGLLAAQNPTNPANATAVPPFAGGILNSGWNPAQACSSGSFTSTALTTANCIARTIPPSLTGSTTGQTMFTVYNQGSTSIYYTYIGTSSGSLTDNSVLAIATPNAGSTQMLYDNSGLTAVSSTQTVTTGRNYMAFGTYTPVVSGSGGLAQIDLFSYQGHDTETANAGPVNWASSQTLSFGGPVTAFPGSAPTSSLSGYFDIPLTQAQINAFETLVANTICSGMGLPSTTIPFVTGTAVALSPAGTSGQVWTMTSSTSQGFSANSPTISGTSILVTGSNLTSQSGAVTVATFTAPALGTYRVGGYLNVASVSVDVIQFQMSWTDENSNVRTQIFYPMGTSTPGLSATGFTPFSPADIRVKASTSGTISTVLTTGAGSITYDVGATVQQTN